MSILDYRIGLSNKTNKGILDSGFNLDGSEMSPEQQQEYEQFKIENNMSSMPLNSNSVAMQFPSTVSDAVPLNELLGFYPDKGIMAMQNKGTLDYPEVNYKMTTEFPNTRGGLIANPEYIDYEKGELYNIDDTGRIPGFTDKIKGGIETMKDKLGPIGDYIKGGGIIGQALKGLGGMFNYKGGIGYMDENGNFVSADELDKLNARGGYYTDVARSARRRDKSIAFMQKRKAEGKAYSKDRLEKFIQQQAAEEAARVSAERAKLDAYFGGSGAGSDGNRYDGAETFEQYSAEPTAYSGSS